MDEQQQGEEEARNKNKKVFRLCLVKTVIASPTLLMFTWIKPN